jgi:molybdate transport system regulatory protein
MAPRRKKFIRAITVRPRVYIGESIAIGPGKIDLLKQVEATRSISAAARALGMSYKHAWLLIESLNQGFGRPVVATATGGRGGGGAALTELGSQLVKRYSAIEACVNVNARAELEALRRLAG